MVTTNELIGALRRRARKEVEFIKEEWGSRETPVIADIGANIGYYTTSFLKSFPKATVYAYEVHPNNLLHLKKLNDTRVVIREYGLLDTNTSLSIGLPDKENINNGHYSIYYTNNNVEVTFKNANDENIKPNIIKLDVEGSEPKILSCKNFFSNAKIVLIEILKDDPFKQNDINLKLLSELGFYYRKNTSKNNQMWIKL